MSAGNWALDAAHQISEDCVKHRNYCRVLDSIVNAFSIAQPGEVVVVVGPSRVGKSRAVEKAVKRLVRPRDGVHERPFVVLQAENASTQGAFSTKAFMQGLCRAIDHPIYGVAEPDDPWGTRVSARVNRTPESVLRDAVEHGLLLLRTRFLIIDEAHHVGYAGRSSANALAVLDSWKCLAHKTSTVLCLVGSYQLLHILAHAPHLLGRQRLIEFPRYLSKEPEDIKAFAHVLEAWSSRMRFERADETLQSWLKVVFTHSFGCVGHLSKWLRSALGEASAGNLAGISEDLLLRTRHPASQEAAIAAEIEAGEQAMSILRPVAAEARSPSNPTTRGKPFQRRTRRFEIQGRN